MEFVHPILQLEKLRLKHGTKMGPALQEEGVETAGRAEGRDRNRGREKLCGDSERPICSDTVVGTGPWHLSGAHIRTGRPGMSLQKASSEFHHMCCSEFQLLEFDVKIENGSTYSSPPVVGQSACIRARVQHTHVQGYTSVISPGSTHFHFSPLSPYLFTKNFFDQ